ncbi:MAG: penicillin-binding transpeptidase domain-containing protein [Anaerolineales bacterium]
MKINRILSFVLMLFLLAGCGGTSTPETLPTDTPALPSPRVAITPAPPPDPLPVVDAFLQAWKVEDYATMYGLLTQDSQKTISADDFGKKYTDAMNNLTLKELDYSVGASQKTTDSAQVSVHVTYKTNVIGDLPRDLTANLKMEGDQWRIAWDDGLILPELHGGNHLAMDISVPARGNIYDSTGKQAIVSQSDAVAIGLVPGEIDPKLEGSMLASISNLVDLYPGTIQGMYANAGSNWYIPVGEVSQADYKKRGGGVLNGFSGVYQYSYNTRFYTNDVAPQTIGYVSAIQPAELNQSLRLGYSRNQLIGRSGIEKWGQDILAGQNGAALHVVAPDGAVVAELGSRPQKPAGNIYLTLNESLQYYAQRGLEGFRGAIVVLERDSGKVLAMASSPGYDPNLFDPGNKNSPNGVVALTNDPNTPSLNRAAQSKYPLGSVFKVITFSAALESGTYTPDSPKIDCPYHFTELPGRVMDDWTWEHYQNELAAGATSFTPPSGILDLSDALMRSCNPWFWHIGLDLYNQGRVTAIANMARGFGLGSPTGIGVIDEAAGNISDPASQLDAVNQAIGQGDVQVTPLQVARLMAAIGNGGTLFRPQLIEKIVDANGNVTQAFKSEANARPLPITNTTLAALQAAMHKVIYNQKGTAYGRFYTIRDQIPLYGKTGTAESGNGQSHAWFAGYTDSTTPGFTNIAIAVIAENAGEGSVIAAPMFKRMIDVYLNGHPTFSYYPWETDFGITRTPTLPVTPTFGP